MTTLATDRLNLRPFAVRDAEVLQAFWAIPEVRRYLWDDRILAMDTVSAIIEQSVRDFREQDWGFFSLDLKATQPVIVGFCGFRRFEDSRDIELLYGILPEYWGEGLVTEAALAVLRHGFGACGMERVIAATDTPNQRAVRVLQRLGMSFEERKVWRGLDTVFYAITAAEFAERQELAER